MSYSRWGVDGSQVYIYDDVSGGTTCCGCLLVGGQRIGSMNTRTHLGVVIHVLHHRTRGHRTRPGLCRDLLRNDG